MTLYTIGFTRKSAQVFFETLKRANVRRIIDIRINNTSQLAGFTKRDDLAYFLTSINGIDYVCRPQWAPTKELLAAYTKKLIGWDEYERQFAALLDSRNLTADDLGNLDGSCLLCSEPSADKCHRRLVAERLQQLIVDLVVCHL